MLVFVLWTAGAWAEEKAPSAELTNAIGMQFALVPIPNGARPLYISKTEVTLAQFRHFKPNHDNGKTPWGRSLDEPDLPVVAVSAAEAKAFCEWLGRRDGGVYRLPTGMEWGIACLAGGKGKYGHGNDALHLTYHAWFNDNAGGLLVAKQDRGPHWVARKLPNAWGLFDTHGNVWEWCVEANGHISARGGGWNSPADQCTAMSILKSPPASELTIGFRVVMTRPPTDDNYGEVYWRRVGQSAIKSLLAPMADKAVISEKARVAVVPLTLEGRGTTQIGVVLASGIESALIETGMYRIVDRQTFDQVLAEKDLAFADLSDKSKVAQATRVLAADLLVNGTLVDLGAELRGMLRLVDVAKGEVLANANFSLPKDANVQSLMSVVVQRPRARPTDGGELPPLALNYDVLAQRELSGGRFEEVIVRDGSTLRSGDQYRIRVRANSDCHFYVITYDSRGDVYVLFPRPEIQLSSAIRGGVTYMIPGEHDPWFTLDDKTGTETLIFIAGYEPLKDLDAMVKQMQAAGGSAASTASAAIQEEVRRLSESRDAENTVDGYSISRTRGTVLNRPKAAYTLGNGRAVQNVMALAEGRSRVVQTIRFNHVK